MKLIISKEEILKVLDYNREQGVLTWKSTAYGKTKNKNITNIELGYLSVGINYKKYKVHRLIYFLETNTWPEMIDHINGNKLDNRIVNLRASDKRRNQQNQYKHREGKLVGATYRKSTGKWRALIKLNKKSYEIGTYDTAEEAHDAYCRELTKHYLNGGT